jgi:hypothetical protein
MIYACALADTKWSTNIYGTVDNPLKNALSLRYVCRYVCRYIYTESRFLLYTYHSSSASHW